MWASSIRSAVKGRVQLDMPDACAVFTVSRQYL
jgi:hypothetical protein